MTEAFGLTFAPRDYGDEDDSAGRPARPRVPLRCALRDGPGRCWQRDAGRPVGRAQGRPTSTSWPSGLSLRSVSVGASSPVRHPGASQRAGVFVLTYESSAERSGADRDRRSVRGAHGGHHSSSRTTVGVSTRPVPTVRRHGAVRRVRPRRRGGRRERNRRYRPAGRNARASQPSRDCRGVARQVNANSQPLVHVCDNSGFCGWVQGDPGKA
jgi:hypothetical protein